MDTYDKMANTISPSWSKEQLAQALRAEYKSLADENTGMKQWIEDLQNNGSVNCVYCGKNYGPVSTTPVSLSEVLKNHIEQCPKHPMAELKESLVGVESALNCIRIGTDPSQTTSDKPSTKMSRKWCDKVYQIFKSAMTKEHT